MPVYAYRDRPREQRVIFIDVTPPRLHHTNGRIGKIGHAPLEEIRVGQKVGIENRYELSLCKHNTLSKSAGFVSISPGAVQQLRRITPAAKLIYTFLCNACGLVRRIIKHLYLQFIFWIVHLRNFFYQAFHHIELIVYRKLYSNHRVIRKNRRLFLLPFPVEIGKDKAVVAVDEKNKQDQKI